MRAVILVLALASSVAHADDLQLWTELGAKHELAKRWSVTLDQHLRFDETVSRVSAVMPELGLHHKLARWARAGIGYRLEYERNGDGELVLRHRVHGYARTFIDIKPVRLEYRAQLQDSMHPSAMDVHRVTLRDRGEVALRGKRIEAAASVELFHDLGPGIGLEKLWLTATGTYERRQQEVALFYRLELPRADDEPLLHIIGLVFHTGV